MPRTFILFLALFLSTQSFGSETLTGDFKIPSTGVTIPLKLELSQYSKPKLKSVRISREMSPDSDEDISYVCTVSIDVAIGKAAVSILGQKQKVSLHYFTSLILPDDGQCNKIPDLSGKTISLSLWSHILFQIKDPALVGKNSELDFQVVTGPALNVKLSLNPATQSYTLNSYSSSSENGAKLGLYWSLYLPTGENPDYPILSESGTVGLK